MVHFLHSLICSYYENVASALKFFNSSDTQFCSRREEQVGDISTVLSDVHQYSKLSGWCSLYDPFIDFSMSLIVSKDV